jgi:hypothetical protein
MDTNELLFLNDCEESYENLDFRIYKLNVFDMAKESNLNLKITEILEISFL